MSVNTITTGGSPVHEEQGILSFLNGVGTNPLLEGTPDPFQLLGMPIYLPALPTPETARENAFQAEIARRAAQGGLLGLMDFVSKVLGELVSSLARLSGEMTKNRGELDNKIAERKANEYLERVKAELARQAGGFLKTLISIVTKAVMLAAVGFLAVTSGGVLAPVLAGLAALYLTVDFSLTCASEATGDDSLRASAIFNGFGHFGLSKSMEKMVEGVVLMVLTLGAAALAYRAAAVAAEKAAEQGTGTLMAQATKFMGMMEGAASIADAGVTGYEGYQQIQYSARLREIAEITYSIKIFEAILKMADRFIQEIGEDIKHANELRHKNLSETLSFLDALGALFVK